MAFVLFDRVREYSDTNGTGAIHVTGVVSGGYQTFDSVLSNGDTTLVCCRNAAGQWQTFLATWNSAAQTLARTTAYEGSSGEGVNVGFSGESQEVWINYPAQWYHTPRFQTVNVGDAGVSNWFSAATGVSAGVGWVTTQSIATLVSPNGTIGYAAASRASDVPGALGTSQISIPFVGIAVMDRTGSGPPYWTSYGAYLEARMEPVSSGNGTVIGLEIDAINFGSVTTQSTPWVRQTTGGATGLWIASGGDPANHGRTIAPAQLAIGVVNNGETFTAGLVFANDAIEGTNGATGFGDAVSFATRHILGWWADTGGAGSRVSYITSTNTVQGHSMQFQDGGTLFITPGGKIDFGVANVSNSVNGVGVVPAIAGASPYLETFGDDTNVPLKIKPKGAGDVEIFAETLLFYSDAGSQLSGVVNGVTSNTYFTTLEFADAGPFFYGRGGVIASFSQVASPVSHLEFSNAASGDPVSIEAQGSGDIDILLDPGGTNGTLKLALPTATSATSGGASALPGAPATYLIVRDGAGTLLKIPAWNT